MKSALLQELAQGLFRQLDSSETLTLNLSGEQSEFTRWNDGKVRQTGEVVDTSLSLQMVWKGPEGFRRNETAVSLSGDPKRDREELDLVLKTLRNEVRQLPVDPYVPEPKNYGKSHRLSEGKYLKGADAIGQVGKQIQGMPLTGIFSSGKMLRANLNSLGQSHWFETDLSTFDFSLIKNAASGDARAVKIDWAGKDWNPDEIESELAVARKKMDALMKPVKAVKRGAHRSYWAPGAVSEITQMITAIFGESYIRQGQSPMKQVRDGKARFSKKFSFTEDFSNGLIPSFNQQGELAPEQLQLVHEGESITSLVSAGTALEYKIASNGASSHEGMRSPYIPGGQLDESKALEALGTGLYLSNLHYLNWSDLIGGRVTGMTRYACFWVENGEWVAPIENLRWDDSIFSIFGSALEELTSVSRFIPNTSTYEFRQLGGVRVPGILLSSVEYTL